MSAPQKRIDKNRSKPRKAISIPDRAALEVRFALNQEELQAMMEKEERFDKKYYYQLMADRFQLMLEEMHQQYPDRCPRPDRFLDVSIAQLITPGSQLMVIPSGEDK